MTVSPLSVARLRSDARRARERKDKVDAGETIVVGVNKYRREDEETSAGEVFRVDKAVAGKVLERYERVCRERDGGAVGKALDRLGEAAAEDGENLMPHLVECCHAYATVGEMVAVMKRQWGEFREPVGI